MPYRGVILDDYSKVARHAADWSQIPEVDFRVFNDPLGSTRNVRGPCGTTAMRADGAPRATSAVRARSVCTIRRSAAWNKLLKPCT